MKKIRYIDKDTNEEYTHAELNIKENECPILGIGTKNSKKFYYETAGDDILIHAPDHTECFRRITKEQYEQFKKEEMRYNRERFLGAFDIWEKAVIRGREQDDPQIMTWYQDLLDLDESAFENVPVRINYYL